MKSTRRTYIALMMGVLSVSIEMIPVWYAQQEAASLTFAAYRMPGDEERNLFAQSTASSFLNQ